MAGLKDLCIEIAPKIPGLAEHEFQTNSHRQDIFRFAPILAQFSFSTNELELDYWHQKVNVRVVSPAAVRLSRTATREATPTFT